MSNKLYDETSVKAIADAIRAKNGTSTTYKIGDMAGAISLLDGGSTDGVLTPSTFPNYIMENVNTIVSRAKTYIKSDSIVFLSMSDFHNSGSEATSNQAQINKSNLHAAMAAKAFAYALKMDFMCNLGDMSWGSKATTEAQQKEQIEIIEGYLTEAFSDVPQFWTPGNHDCGKSSEVFSGGLGASYLFSHIGAHSNGATYGSMTSGYCYRDFADKSLRAICLNTCDENEKEALTDTQKLWLCNTLNSTPSGYNIITLSHHPLDWCDIRPASEIIYQYQLRGSYIVSGTTVSFAGAKANVICAFHGHVHGYKVDKLTRLVDGVGTPYNVYRMATPNCCFIRNNEYGQNEGPEWSDGVEFGETTTYNKTADTVNDTAMTLNVINPTDKMIYSFTYGAGPAIRSFSYDMTVEAPTIYTITTNASNGAVISVSATAEEGTSISGTYSISDGYELKSVVVTMGGTDITSTAVSGTSINITEVTGNIVITVIAAEKSKYNVTNLVLTSEEQTSTVVYNNGLGYKDGYKSSEGSSGAESLASGYTVTGFIPYTWNPSNVIYIRGAELSNDSSTRIYGYTNKATGVVSSSAYASGSRIYVDDNIYFKLETLEEGTYYKLTPVKNLTNITHIRISLKGTGEKLIVTVNEPIEEQAEKIAVTGVTLNTSQIDSMTVGDTYQLTATVSPSNATNKNVTWSITNTSYANVSSTGLITAKAASSSNPAAIITATTVDGSYTASCALSKVVGVAVTGVSLNTNQIELEVGKTYQLTATITPSNATNKAVTWTSNNNEYVTVSSTGLVTAKAVADASPAAYITVTTSDGGFTAQASVVVKESTPVNYTNLVPTLLEPGSDELMNGGLGYRDGYYASAASPGYATDSATVCTGALPFTKDLYPAGTSVDFYVKGINFDGTSHCRVCCVSYSNDAYSSWSSNNNVKEGYTSAWASCATCEKLGDNYFKFTFTPVYANGSMSVSVAKIWFSAKGTGENLIITKNEPIE